MTGRIDQFYFKNPIVMQNAMVTAYGLKIYCREYGRKFKTYLESFEKSQWLSESQLSEYQERLLKKLIQYSYEKVPYYNELMRELRLTPSDFNTIEDLIKLPLLTRETVRKNTVKLKSVNFNKRGLAYGHTNGTTVLLSAYAGIRIHVL